MNARLYRFYVEAIGLLATPGTTFCVEACRLRNELLSPDNDLHELLRWIDQQPETPFEMHLRRQAHAKAHKTQQQEYA